MSSIKPAGEHNVCVCARGALSNAALLLSHVRRRAPVQRRRALTSARGDRALRTSVCGVACMNHVRAHYAFFSQQTAHKFTMRSTYVLVFLRTLVAQTPSHSSVLATPSSSTVLCSTPYSRISCVCAYSQTWRHGTPHAVDAHCVSVSECRSVRAVCPRAL